MADQCEATKASKFPAISGFSPLRCIKEKGHAGPHYAERGSDTVHKCEWNDDEKK